MYNLNKKIIKLFLLLELKIIEEVMRLIKAKENIREISYQQWKDGGYLI